MYTYQTFTVITDNGPYITKLLLNAPVELRAEALRPEAFCVYVERRHPETGELFMASKTWRGEKSYPSKGYREVTAVYPCNEQGEPVMKSKTIALEMPYGPCYPLGYSQAWFGWMNIFVRSDYRIMQVREISAEIAVSGMVFDEYAGDICPQCKHWENGRSAYAPMPLGYGLFTPDFAQIRKDMKKAAALGKPVGKLPKKFPLVIWLHGAGEGGNDPTVAYTGNKVVALSESDIQRKLGGAAYILAPQAPTMWMDMGDARYTTNGESIYTEALMACIEEVVGIHKDIDPSRIYIGGCSNGGYMTMRMILRYPDFFAAAYPVCEAFEDEWITDEDIARIKDLPIWFIHAANDPVVPPERTVLPTFKRLRAAGGKNIHASYFDRVVDQSGLFRDELGRPYEYSGHFAWVHTFNDFCTTDMDGTRVLCDGIPVSLWQWIGLQKK